MRGGGDVAGRAPRARAAGAGARPRPVRSAQPPGRLAPHHPLTPPRPPAVQANLEANTFVIAGNNVETRGGAAGAAAAGNDDDDDMPALDGSNFEDAAK